MTETVAPPRGPGVAAPGGGRGGSGGAGGGSVHAVLAFAEALESALDKASVVEPAYAPTADKRQALVALHRAEQRLHAVRLKLVAASADVAEVAGARSVPAWLESHTDQPTEHGPHKRDAELAVGLEHRWPATGQALIDGHLTVGHAEVIVHGLDELAGDRTAYVDADGREMVGVPAETVAEAEAHLIGAAGEHTPRQLRRLARRILAIVAPGLDDEREARKLRDAERRARERTSLFTRKVGDGCTRFSITVPDATARRLLDYLEAFTAPRAGGTGQVDPAAPLDFSGPAGSAVPGEPLVPSYRRKGQAFCALLETLDPHRLPLHGGDATTLIVTVGLAELRRLLATAGLGFDGTDRITAAEARRLACTATIIPAVLDGESQPLDLGRAARLFSPAQRKAMGLRDKTCRAEGCTVPANWCEAHHNRDPWSQGGRTDLDDGILLCPWHHHRAHDDRYLRQRLPTGDLRFHRRT